MNNSKIITGAIVAGILLILLLSSPAQAFILRIVASDTNIVQGQIIDFNVNVQMQDSETPDNIDYLVFRLTGPKEVDCRFSVEGKNISECRGMKIEKINSSDGYLNCDSYNDGYANECILNYKIIFDSQGYDPGTYHSFLLVFQNGESTEKKGKDITIKLRNKVCSIRADNGRISIDSRNFTNAKINFYVPFQNAGKGGGSIVGQKDRESFSYNFNVNTILENDNNHMLLSVSGKYKIGRDGKITEDSLIYLDKKLNLIRVEGKNINLQNTKITFREGCD